jgi:fibronectin-binding autotransporter adhesin
MHKLTRLSAQSLSGGGRVWSKGRRCALMAAAVGAVGIAAPAWATTTNWSDGSSNWNNGGNWSNGIPATTGEIANITDSDGTSRVITYDYNGTAVTIGVLTVGNNGTGTLTATNTLLMVTSSLVLSTSGEFIGSSGSPTLASLGVLTQSASTNNVAGTLTLGNFTRDNGIYNLSGTGALAVTLTEDIGNSGTGAFTQSGGTNTIGSALFAGFNSASNGSYALSSGTLGVTSSTNVSSGGNFVGSGEYIGFSGTGGFTQTGGMNANLGALLLGYNSGATGSYTQSAGVDSSTLAIYLGYLSGATGTYTLSGTGTVTAAAGEQIGVSGAGTFVQNGGANQVNAGVLTVAANGGATGAYLLNGGFLTGTTEIVANGSSSASTGTFTQSGGSNNATTMIVSEFVGDSGNYNLNGGALTLTGSELVGQGGVAVFSQTAGSNVAGTLSLGNGGAANGTYLLTAGALSVNSGETIGKFSVGSFTQIGGTNTAASLAIADNVGSTGSYTLTGGNLNINGPIAVGGDPVNGAGGVGTFTVTGNGVATDTTTLTVFNATGNGLTLTGGTINTPAMNLGGNSGLLNWTGGTLDLTTSSVTFDPTASATSTGAVFGSGLTLNNGQTLEISGNETLGGTGTFALTLNAGSIHSVGGSITLPSTGTITQNAGSALYYGSFTEAGGSINGTLQNQTQFTYSSGQFNGRLVNQGSVNFGSNFVVGNGIENDATMYVNTGQTLTLNGQGLDNIGSFTLDGGTLAGNGAILNDFSGTMNAAGSIPGGFTNEGNMIVNGVLTAGGTDTNLGQLAISASATLRGGTLDNYDALTINGGSDTDATTNFGLITLNGGAVNAALTNSAGGVIAGYGSITNLQGSNIGGQIRVSTAGPLTIFDSWSNFGLVTLNGANAMLDGANITNSGTIQGSGQIGSLLLNPNGIIAPSGGQLTIAASGSSNGTSAQLQIATGSTLFYTQGLSVNSGVIALSGGTFSNNNLPLLNSATGNIAGSGSISTGGTGLTSQGSVNFADSPTTVYGAFSTSYSGTAASVVNITNNTTTFYGTVTVGTLTTFNVNQANARFLGGFVNNGTYHTDPSTSYFSNVNITASGAIQASPTDLYQVTGNYTSSSTQVATWNTSGAELEFSGGGTHQMTVTGSAAASPWGILAVDSGNRLVLTANSATSAVNSLQIGTTGVLDMTNNSLAIDYAGEADPVAAIASYLSSGFNGGKWNGTAGIVSSTAAGGGILPILSIGYADGNLDSGTAAQANQILIRYTLAGDANLDGMVNFADLLVVAQNFNKTGEDWAKGNFVYSPTGLVNFNDLLIVAQNFNKVLTPAGSSFETVGGNVQSLDVTLPEPGAAALILVSSLGLLPRRRRNR